MTKFDERKLFDLTGRVAMVTGGGRGLGFQMATGLGEAGAKLILTARKGSELEEARAELAAAGIESATFVNDLSKFDTIPAVAEAAARQFGRIDILVNNAGASWGAPAEEYPFDAWMKVVNLNLNGLWLMTQEVAKRTMLPAKSGSIINIASIAGFKGSLPPMQTIAYHTTKTGVIGFTRQLAAEWGAHNIRVNAIAPGWFESKMASGVIEQLGERAHANCLGRIGGPHDLMGPVVFLASDAAAHVTGHTLVVDGGESAI
jgi:gluconate 5-dehydrogenase